MRTELPIVENGSEFPIGEDQLDHSCRNTQTSALSTGFLLIESPIGNPLTLSWESQSGNCQMVWLVVGSPSGVPA